MKKKTTGNLRGFWRDPKIPAYDNEKLPALKMNGEFKKIQIISYNAK